ncbi:hypothetical protein [Hymenobacter negativus]|uniref:hypothetical protein n=1 Tax=Hymenobacter negativus TaxID=2795026 RepID=UPI001AAE79B7|nr:hypothetical protein [Hymenobacter negativus]
MAQKVITVVVAPTFTDKELTEFDFPEVSKTLKEGYFVKDVHSVVTEGPKSRVTFVFVLQR